VNHRYCQQILNAGMEPVPYRYAFRGMCGRFGYSDLKEAARPEGAGMGFLLGRSHSAECLDVFMLR
jgi:hypothetical protein